MNKLSQPQMHALVCILELWMKFHPKIGDKYSADKNELNSPI
jgi:hypothetical protein